MKQLFKSNAIVLRSYYACIVYESKVYGFIINVIIIFIKILLHILLLYMYTPISDWIACFTPVFILCFYRWKIIRQTNSNDTENMIDILMNFNINNYFVGSELFGYRFFSVFVCSRFISFVMSFTSRFCCLLFAICYFIWKSRYPLPTLKEHWRAICGELRPLFTHPTDILWNIQFQQNNKYGNYDYCYDYYFHSFTTMTIWFDDQYAR